MYVEKKYSSAKTGYNGSHHKLIYGFPLSDSLDSEESNHGNPFRKYYLPMYGCDDVGEGGFIGFEYGRVNGLFDNFNPSYNGRLCFNTAEVPREIIQLFKERYPNRQAKCYALLQNAYTSHYACGEIMYGYAITLNESDPGEDADTLNDHTHTKLEGDLSGKLQIVEVGHNMDTSSAQRSSCSYDYFVGTSINGFTTCEDNDGCEKLAEELSTQYRAPHDFPSKEEIQTILDKIGGTEKPIKYSLSFLPMLVFVQTMCYCCT